MNADAIDMGDYPARPHLANSGPLRWNLRAGTTAVVEAIDGLLAELEAGEERTRQRKQADRERLRATMEAMVFGLVAAYGTAKPWRAYSRQKADYAFFVDHAAVSWTAVTMVADFLIARGLAEGRRGSFKRPEGQARGWGYQSRLRATPLLLGRSDDLTIEAIWRWPRV